MRKPFETPTLETLGTIMDITGTWGEHEDSCYDFGWEKGIGYPSDTFWKFFPICDPDDNGGVS